MLLVTTPLMGPVELLPLLGAGTSVAVVALLPPFDGSVVVGAFGTPPMFSKLAQAMRDLLAKWTTKLRFPKNEPIPSLRETYGSMKVAM